MNLAFQIQTLTCFYPNLDQLGKSEVIIFKSYIVRAGPKCEKNYENFY